MGDLYSGCLIGMGTGSMAGAELGYHRSVALGFRTISRGRARNVCAGATFGAGVGAPIGGAFGVFNQWAIGDESQGLEVRESDREL